MQGGDNVRTYFPGIFGTHNLCLSVVPRLIPRGTRMRVRTSDQCSSSYGGQESWLEERPGNTFKVMPIVTFFPAKPNFSECLQYHKVAPPVTD